MKTFIVFLLLLFTRLTFAQTDSCNIRISLLTCTPGEELYSTFGHSAVRVINKSTNEDLVFNYGTFDFYDPHFYKKFIKGNLLYFLSVDSLPGFLSEYEYFKRGVTEQVLNLSCNERLTMLNALLENAKEENKYYRYDFNYDNCTTRLRDIIEKITGQPLQTKNILTYKDATFRSLIHDYLKQGGQLWSMLGIDILLGTPLDKKINTREAMFLPDYLLKAFDSSMVNNRNLVIEKKNLLPPNAISQTKPVFSPLLVSLLLFLFIAILSFLNSPRWKIFFNFFDFVFFLLLGSIGLLLLFMWFYTDHAMCKNNFNLLWALPTHLPMSLLMFNNKKWVKSYFYIIFLFSIILIIAWFFLPQQLHTALLPVTGIILVRSYLRSK